MRQSQLGLFENAAAPPRQPVSPTPTTGQDKGAIAPGASPVVNAPASKSPKVSVSNRVGNAPTVAPVVATKPTVSAPSPPQSEKAIAPKASPEDDPRIVPYGLCKCGEAIDIPGTDSNHCPACGWVSYRSVASSQ